MQARRGPSRTRTTPQRSVRGAAGHAPGTGQEPVDGLVLRIEQRLYDAILQHVSEALPNEGCGLLAFDDDRPVKVYPGRNVLESPSRYRMADIEVLRAVDDMTKHSWWLGAIYHSHPKSPARPSLTDLNEANWPDALMIIVSLMESEPDLRAWRVRETPSGRTYDDVIVEVYRERLPLLANIQRSATRGFRNPTRPARKRAVWQPVGPVRVGSPLVAASGSEQPDVARDVPSIDEGLLEQPEDDGDTLEAEMEASYERRATIGILGGMGPLATADVYRKIIESTPAAVDQEHIPVVIHADPRVPDRTKALLHNGEDPTPWLVHGTRQLINIGADFIIIPCNTAHAFLDQIQPAIDKPIVSMIDAAADEIRHGYPRARAVGLLATSGTIASSIYQRALEERGLSVLVPDEETQERCVMGAIHEVKGGRGTSSATALLQEASQRLLDAGADVLLEACTEIPIALQPRHLPSGTPLVDATASLARMAIATARHLDESARSGDPQWETSTTGWGIAADGGGGKGGA